MYVVYARGDDKIMRMHAQSAKIEAGQVYLPDKAPWLQDFETEMMQFPNGKLRRSGR